MYIGRVPSWSGFFLFLSAIKRPATFVSVAGPKHLGPAVGRSEINKSLRTADKSIAIPQAMRLSADCQVQFKLLNDDTYLNVCCEAESKDYP